MINTFSNIWLFKTQNLLNHPWVNMDMMNLKWFKNPSKTHRDLWLFYLAPFAALLIVLKIISLLLAQLYELDYLWYIVGWMAFFSSVPIFTLLHLQVCNMIGLHNSFVTSELVYISNMEPARWIDIQRCRFELHLLPLRHVLVWGRLMWLILLCTFFLFPFSRNISTTLPTVANWFILFFLHQFFQSNTPIYLVLGWRIARKDSDKFQVTALAIGIVICHLFVSGLFLFYSFWWIITVPLYGLFVQYVSRGFVLHLYSSHYD
jgi:hypothetical protein